MQEVTNPQQGNPALENAYKLAQSKGYKKDINSFKTLISSDEVALNNIYNEVKTKGYKKDINSFKELVGVTSLKKKDGTKPNSTSTSVSTKQVSEQKSGSSGTPKFKLAGEKEKVNPNVNYDNYDLEQNSAVVEKKAPKSKNYTVASTAYNYALNNVDKSLAEQRYKDEVDNYQFLDGVKQGMKNTFNTFIGNPLTKLNESLGGNKDFTISQYKPLESELKQAKKELFDERGNNKFTEEEIQERAKKIFIDKDIQEQLHSNIDKALPSGYDREGIWKELKLEQLRSNDILREKVASAEVFKSKIEEFEEFSKNINKENPTEQDIQKFNTLKEEALTAVDGLNYLSKNYDKYVDQAKNDEEKLELFKYNYNDLEKNAKLFYTSSLNIIGGTLKLAGETNTYIDEQLGIVPIGGTLQSELGSEMMNDAKKTSDPFYRYKATKLNSWSDVGSFVTQLSSEQLPILASIYLGGNAGIAATSMSSGGQKINDLEEQEKQPFSKKYSDGEKLATGWLYAGAEFFPEKIGTARILKDLERTVSSASTASRKLFRDSFIKQTTEGVKKLAYYSGLEGSTELVTAQGQITIDEELLDIVKTDAENNEQRMESFFSGAIMGGGMSVVGGGLGFVTAQAKLYSDAKDVKEVKSILSNVQGIQNEIETNVLLTDKERTELYQEMNVLTNQAFETIAKNANKATEFSVEEKSALLDINLRQAELKSKYQEIADSNFSKEIKNKKVQELESEYNSLEEKRSSVLKGEFNTTKQDALQQEATITKAKSETQPQAEVKAEVGEVNQKILDLEQQRDTEIEALKEKRLYDTKYIEPIREKYNNLILEEKSKGFDLFHTGNEGLSIESVSVDPRVTRQGKKGKYGGFYTYDNIGNIISFLKGNKTSTVYGIKLNDGVEITDYNGSIERLNAEKLQELRDSGVKVIRGKSIVGKTEIIVVDKSAIKSIEKINETAPSQVDNVDGNIQHGNNVVEPSGTTEQENNQAGDVQPTDNGRNVEVKREIKIADKGQSYTVEKTDLGLVITDKKGKKPSKVTERKILDEYSKTINFTQGTRVDDSFESSEETYIDDIASKSQNASEIAEAIAYVEVADMNEGKVDPIQVAIARALGEKSVERSSFTNVNDRNNITQSIAMQYFAEKGKKGKGLDEIAMEVEVEVYGDYNANFPRITEEDIANFIVDNPKGAFEFLNRNRNEALEKLRTAFTDVTGLPAKTQFIEAAIKQNTDFKNEIFNGNSLYLYSDEDLLSLQKQREEFEKSIEYGKQSKKQSEAANEIAEGINNQPDNKDGKQTPGIQKDSGTGYRAKNEPEVTPEEKPSSLDEKIEKDKLSDVLDWLDGLKLDPNDLNATLPFLPQSWNMFIEAVKLAVKAGKTINEAIQEAIKKLQNEGIGNDEINAIVEKFTGQVTKKVESGTFKKKSGKSKSTTNESGQKPQAFTTRAFNAENISGRTRDKLDGLGLNYDVESQAKAQENAETIIAELGIIDAYNLAKEGKIRGGARTWIMAQMFEDLNNQINEASEKGETDLVEYLSDELSKIMKEFANEKTLTGQEIAMLNRIYNKFGMKYDLEFARENWKKRFGNEIPVEVEAKLKKAEAEIKEYEKQVKELEERIGTLEEQDAMDNLKDVVKRHNTNKPSPSSLKKAAEALRKAKFTKSLTDLSKLNSNPLLVVTGIFDGAIEIIATALDAGSTIEQAVKKGVEHIKSSDWYKSLSASGKTQAEKIAKNDFKKFIKEQVSIPTSSVEVEQGAIKIPSDLIYSLVQSGIDNISDLTQAVHDAISEEYPNLTLREVRDAITGYGKQVAETKDDIKKEISRLKTDGKQMSALDDLAEGNRPKRSGRKAKEYTPEQRNRIKKIRELLKKLPIDDTVDKAKYYKNALEALKTRLENRIKDLNDAINKNERIVNERRNTILDDDAKELVKKRDEAQKEYDDYFGKPYKSDETLINEIVARKEKSLRELELKIESVKLEGKELPVKERRTVSDPKIDALNKQIEEKRNELNDALEVVGIAESKRLDRAVKYSKRRLKELNEKIANGDFTRRKPKTYKYNRELIELKGKILIAKTKWDIEFEKQEFRKLGYSEKLLEYVYRLFGTVKGLKATFDLSAMLRQGVVLGSRNPKEYAKASVEMHKFAFDSKYYKDWMTELETSDDYIYMVEDGLSITDTSGDVLKSEERFVGNLLSTEVKVDGVNVNLVGRITDGSERAYGGFLNSLRVSVYRKIAKQYEVMGITRQEHPKKFKNIAKFVNNSTGRGVMTSDKRIAKALNIVFFSPRMITGMAGVVKDLVRSESTPYLRKQAATSLLSFMAYQFVMKMLIKQALILVGSLFDDDDDDEITMDMNPVSADFNKVRKGDKRYDVSSGYGIGVRTASRFILNETSKGIGEENKSFNDVYGKNRFNEVGSFFVNKLSPLSSQIYKYGIGEHPTEFKGKREDATAMDYTSALLIPISVTDLIENVQNDTPEGQMFLDLMLNTYGVSVQNYGDNKKSKNNKY